MIDFERSILFDWMCIIKHPQLVMCWVQTSDDAGKRKIGFISKTKMSLKTALQAWGSRTLLLAQPEQQKILPRYLAPCRGRGYLYYLGQGTSKVLPCTWGDRVRDSRMILRGKPQSAGLHPHYLHSFLKSFHFNILYDGCWRCWLSQKDYWLIHWEKKQVCHFTK